MHFSLFNILTLSFRTHPSEDSKSIELEQTLEIPRRPKPSPIKSSEDTPISNGTSGPGKRKRDEDEEMTNGHVSKRVAGEQTNGDANGIIVLDEQDEGAILID